MIRTLETIYTGAEYCGIADAKANQATFSKLTYYSMLAGPLVAILMPSFISKFSILNTLNIFVLFPFELPFYFKLRFKLFSDLNQQDFIGKYIVDWFDIKPNDNMTIFINKEFNFQRIYSIKMMFQTIMMVLFLCLFFRSLRDKYWKDTPRSRTIRQFIRDQFLNQAVINYTRSLIFFDLCYRAVFNFFDGIILTIAFAVFCIQQFIVMTIYFDDNNLSKWNLISKRK